MSTSGIRNRRIQTCVGELNVEVRGDGPAVLCWPSLYGDARTVDPIADDLGRDHRVVVVDGPGHGRSGPSPGMVTLDDCAGAAIEILDALGLARVAWIGPAWGGHVGVMAARRHPARLDGLVILNAPMHAWRGRQRLLMQLAYSLLWIFGPRSFIASTIASSMVSPRANGREAIVELLTAALRGCDRAALLPVVHSMMLGRSDMVPVLSDVRVPTLFFAGAHDALFPVESARAQASTIPDCRFVVVETSAHCSALEAPAVVLPTIRDAVASWQARAAAVGTAHA